jgi:hypothetical protein
MAEIRHQSQMNKSATRMIVAEIRHPPTTTSRQTPMTTPSSATLRNITQTTPPPDGDAVAAKRG